MDVPRSKVCTLAAAILLGACGGKDPMGPGGNNNNQRMILANPSFAADINEIIQRMGCSGGSCHGAPGGQAGMVLTTSAAANYAQWVNVDATSESFKRVLPGDADNSYVVIKVEGRQSVGGQMPLNGGALDNIDLTNLKNWINNGAPNN